MNRLPVAIAVVLLSTVLAGCAERLAPAATGSGPEASLVRIDVFPPTGNAHTTFHFTTGPVTAPGYRYAWDLGDGKRAEGPTVSHKYGFTNGIVRVTLAVTDASGMTTRAQRDLVLGTGKNAAPTPALEVSTEWAEVGAPVTLSAAASADPDGDALRYDWSYVLVEDHGPIDDEQAIPQRAREFNHTFTEPGYYKLKVRVTDPKRAEATAERVIAVTDTIPSRTLEERFTGALAAGSAGAGLSQEVWTRMRENTRVDAETHGYTLQYPATTTFYLNWTDPGAGANDLDLLVIDYETGEVVARAETRGPANAQEVLVTEQGRGTYGIVVRAYSGARIDYTLDLRAALLITPADLMPAHRH